MTNNVTKYHRSIYAQFRCGILPLHIETGRYATYNLTCRISYAKTTTIVVGLAQYRLGIFLIPLRIETGRYDNTPVGK